MTGKCIIFDLDLFSAGGVPGAVAAGGDEFVREAGEGEMSFSSHGDVITDEIEGNPDDVVEFWSPDAKCHQKLKEDWEGEIVEGFEHDRRNQNSQ